MKGTTKRDLAVDLAAEIGVEADAEDQHPEDRPADAADELAAVAQRALHLAQPEAVEPAELDQPRRSRARRRRSSRVLSAAPAEGVGRLARPRRPVAQLAPGQREETARGSASRPRAADAGRRSRRGSLRRRLAVRAQHDLAAARSVTIRSAKAARIASAPPRRAAVDPQDCWPCARFSASGRAVGEDPAAVDDADPVAALDLLDVVRGDERRSAAAPRAGGGDSPRSARGSARRARPSARRAAGSRESWISARAISSRRFIPDERVRTGRRRPVGRARRAPASRRCAGCAARARHAVDEAVQVEVLAHRQPVVEARLLEDDAELLPRLERLAHHVEAADPRRAAVRRGDGAEDVHQRRLARAVRAEQREELCPRRPSRMTASSASVRP